MCLLNLAMNITTIRMKTYMSVLRGLSSQEYSLVMRPAHYTESHVICNNNLVR